MPKQAKNAPKPVYIVYTGTGICDYIANKSGTKTTSRISSAHIFKTPPKIANENGYGLITLAKWR